MTSDFWRPGDTVMLRDVGNFSGILWCRPHTVVHDGPDYTALYQPEGSLIHRYRMEEGTFGPPAPVLVVVQRGVGVVLARPGIDDVVDQVGRDPAHALSSPRRRRPPRRRRRRLRGWFGSSSSSSRPSLLASTSGSSALPPAARSSRA